MFPWFQLPASVMSSTPATEFLMTVDNPERYVVGNIPMEEPELSLKLDIIPSIYFGGVALMLAILIIQLTVQAMRIRRLRREYPVYGRGNGFDIPKGALLILIPDNTEPYSFFKHIIVGTRGLDEEEMRCILAHESVHVSRNHSIDIVCMRVSCCVLWFIPFAWMMLNELRSVHEYQADAAAADGDNKDYLQTYRYDEQNEIALRRMENAGRAACGGTADDGGLQACNCRKSRHQRRSDGRSDCRRG